MDSAAYDDDDYLVTLDDLVELAGNFARSADTSDLDALQRELDFWNGQATVEF